MVNMKPKLQQRPQDADDTRIMGNMLKKAEAILKEAFRSTVSFSYMADMERHGYWNTFKPRWKIHHELQTLDMAFNNLSIFQIALFLLSNLFYVFTLTFWNGDI